MFERYLAIPYRKGGRTWDGCDCWGLVRLVLKEERGIILPSFDSVSTSEDFGRLRLMFTHVEKPEDFDLVDLRVRGPFFAHVGLYHSGAVIQMYTGGVALQPLARVSAAVKGFYRPESGIIHAGLD